MHVLIVDDQRSARRTLVSILEEFEGVVVVEAATLDEARRALERNAIDLALIDVCLSEDARNRDGLTFVREVASKTTAVPVCVTGSRDMEVIRTAMRNGAYDYMLKGDLCEEVLAPLIHGMRDRRRLEREVAELRARVSPDAAPPGLIGTSEAMERLRWIIKRVALSDEHVLITGPAGAGKEVVARAIHLLGPHPEAPLLDLNCGGIPETLVESTLFGHVKGAFTSAERSAGYLASAGVGTLFLDEIAEMSGDAQTKLLRVLETKRFRPVGTTTESTFEGRVVAATHADLEERVRQKQFRDDLFHRLNVLVVRVPPLDERRGDIPALIAHFVKQRQRPPRFTPAALEALMSQSWPGNVRQLRNLVARVAVFVESGEVTPEVLRDVTDGRAADADELLRRAAQTIMQLPHPDKLAGIKAALIAEAMAVSDDNKSAAARLLGVNRKVVERYLERPGDSDPPDALS